MYFFFLETFPQKSYRFSFFLLLKKGIYFLSLVLFVLTLFNPFKVYAYDNRLVSDFSGASTINISNGSNPCIYSLGFASSTLSGKVLTDVFVETFANGASQFITSFYGTGIPTSTYTFPVNGGATGLLPLIPAGVWDYYYFDFNDIQLPDVIPSDFKFKFTTNSTYGYCRGTSNTDFHFSLNGYSPMVASSSTSTSSIYVPVPYNYSMPQLETIVCQTATCTLNYATTTNIALDMQTIGWIFLLSILIAAVGAFLAYKFL